MWYCNIKGKMFDFDLFFSTYLNHSKKSTFILYLPTFYVFEKKNTENANYVINNVF